MKIWIAILAFSKGREKFWRESWLLNSSASKWSYRRHQPERREVPCPRGYSRFLSLRMQQSEKLWLRYLLSRVETVSAQGIKSTKIIKKLVPFRRILTAATWRSTKKHRHSAMEACTLGTESRAEIFPAITKLDKNCTSYLYLFWQILFEINLSYFTDKNARQKSW